MNNIINMDIFIKISLIVKYLPQFNERAAIFNLAIHNMTLKEGSLWELKRADNHMYLIFIFIS